MKSYKLFIGIAALFGLIAVAIGALSAHAPDHGLSIESIARIDTGLKYQFYHVIVLLGVGILLSLHRNFDSLTLKFSGLTLVLGIILFSGSLYAYAITGNEVFSKITPFGGISLMLGWLFLFLFSFRR